MSEPMIVLRGLTTYDRLELGDAEGISFEKDGIDPNAAGEPVTLTAFVTMAAVSTFAAWLLRKHNEKAFTETVEIFKDGQLVARRTLTYSGSSSEPPQASLIKQITAAIPGVG